MSSKNVRSSSRPRDVYPTPVPLVRAGLKRLGELYPAFAPKTLFEPGCNHAPFLDAGRAIFPSVQTTVGVDILPQVIAPVHTFVQADYLCWVAPGPADLIATNVPFSLAEAFIRRSLAILSVHGLALFLLRLSILGSAKRLPLWTRDVDLRHVLIITPRPSFTGGGTDSDEYGFFVVARGPTSGAPTFSWISDWKPPRQSANTQGRRAITAA